MEFHMWWYAKWEVADGTCLICSRIKSYYEGDCLWRRGAFKMFARDLSFYFTS
jgi:hypothetical protein